MAFTAISVLTFNNRARKWTATGDNAATSLTVPDDGTYKRATGFTRSGVSTAINTSTGQDSLSGYGGLYGPTGGTNRPITSTTCNADGTLTVVFTTAPTNGQVVTGVTVFTESQPEI